MISDQLRTKQGPLARVWLASHWERKISKSQFLQTDLKKTIDAITTNQEEEPIALRVSGQLLLGVVRIYSRKTRYLLEDCNEALIKIKLAFKKGDVNMPNIQHSVANANTITLQDQLTEFDILLPDLPFNPTNVDNERDPVLDSIGDMSMSQDITLNDMQGGFSFGNYELGRGQDGIEVGRRDNEAGYLDNEFDMDAIADPLKDMNINEADNGLAMDNIEFDFDMADNIDYNDDNDIYNHNFDLPSTEEAPLVDVGIVQDDSTAFDMENMVTEPTARRRRKLVVDENTEIPQADLYRYINDTSSIVSKPDHTSHNTKNATTPSLTKPTGDKLCSELDSMFSRMLNKRRASVDASEFQRQADAFGAPTPAAITDDAAFHYEDNDVDYGEDYDGGFDQAAHDNFESNVNAHNNYEDLMTQNTQSFNNNTHQTLETINGYLVSQNNVKFGELAPRSIKKAEASKLFYDVLLLATKNKIKVKQDRSFGEIQISAPTLVH